MMENEIVLTTLDRKVDVVIKRSGEDLRFFVRPFAGSFTHRNTRNFNNSLDVIRHLDERGYGYAAEMIKSGIETLE